MFRRLRLIGITVAVIAIGATPALAIYAHLSTALTGPAINGVVPQGAASVDQSGLPKHAGCVGVTVSNVNLPDGTILNVVLTDCGPDAVGTFKLQGGAGKLDTALPRGCQIGAASSIYVRDGSTTILSGGSRWTAVFSSKCCCP